ncbi:MAG: S41 family peptidase [Rhodospirillaceae bacterium]
MKHSFLMRLTMVTGAMLVAALAFTGAPPPAAAEDKKDAKRTQNSEETYRLLNLFGDVFERIRAQYVDEPTDEQMVEAAIAGMLKALDPHSSYMNQQSYKEMQVNTRGEFGGLGIQVTMDNGVVKIISPIDDTPAHRAGVKSGDYITHLDGDPVQGLTLSQAVEKMRGKVGSPIKLTIFREGKEPFDVSITRDVIKITSVRHKIEGKVGYLRITSFSEQTSIGLDKAVKEIKKELGDKLLGYVLDLRNNPGGLLDQAVAVSDAFLEKGEIVSTRSRDPNDTQRFNATKGDITDGKPIVVLINGGSASASEIVAGALQDHRRAILMGTRSFGKGSVQTIIPLQGRRAMRLTTARYYTPSGDSIQAKGIHPDIEVKQARIEDVDGAPSRREENLRGALENTDPAGEAKEEAKPKQPEAKKTEKKEQDAKKESADYQLMRAIDLLRGVALFSGSLTSSTN